MKKFLFGIILVCLFANPALAVNWCNDANNVGCWLMEDSGTESDEGGNTSSDLTVTSGDTIPQSATHKFGDYSRDFEYGDGEGLEGSDGGGWDISGADQQMSVGFWIYPESVGGTYKTITGAGVIGESGYISWYLRWVESKARFYMSGDGSSASSAVSATSFSNDSGVWQNLFFTYDDSYLRIYVDAVLDSNGTNNPKAYTAGIYNSSVGFVIGNIYSNHSTLALSTGYDGLLDDYGLFSTALDSTNIDDIMTNGLVQATATRNRMIMIE